MAKVSWQTGLYLKVRSIAQTEDKQHLRRLAALLRGLAARVEQKADGKTSALLVEYPDIPVKYFSACIGVPYNVGLKIYKQWHAENCFEVLKRRKISFLDECKWLKVLTDKVKP